MVFSLISCSWRNSRHRENKRRKKISYHIVFVLMCHSGFPNPNLNLAEGRAWASEKGEWPQLLQELARSSAAAFLGSRSSFLIAMAQYISMFALTARSHLTSMQLYLPSVAQTFPFQPGAFQGSQRQHFNSVSIFTWCSPCVSGSSRDHRTKLTGRL